MKTIMRTLLPVLLLGIVSCGDDEDTVVVVPPAQPGAAPAASVSIRPDAMSFGDDAFVPNPLQVEVGTIVTWTNNDSIDHTVTSTDGVWDSGVIPPGGTFSRSFDQAGGFDYFCTIHPQMRGTVFAGVSPSPSPTASPTRTPRPSPTPTFSPSPFPTPTITSED